MHADKRGSGGNSGNPQQELTAQIEAESDPLSKVELLLQLAKTEAETDPQGAAFAARQALELARACNEPRLVAQASHRLALVCYGLGDYPGASAHAQAGLDIAVQLGDIVLENKVTTLLGLTSWQTGDSAQAVKWYEQSLACARKIGDAKSLSDVYTNLSILHRIGGELAKALELQFKALELDQGRKESRAIADSHINLGAIYGDLGNWEKSTEYFYRALVEFEKLQDQGGMALCHADIAEIYLNRGKYDLAMEHTETAIRCAEETQSPPDRLAALGRLGEACFRAGDYPRARTIFDQNIRIAREFGIALELAMNLRRKAELLLATGEATEAIELLEQALPIAEKAGSQGSQAGILRALAQAYALGGNPEQAQHRFESAMALLKTAEKSYDLAQVSFDYGRFLIAQSQGETTRLNEGYSPRGLALVQEAARIFKRLEVINESEAAERYLLQISTDQDRRVSLLRSLISLTTHFLPLAEFAPRCLAILKDALGYSEASFVVENGRRFVLGKVCTDEELRLCQRGEVIITDTAIALPLRHNGRNVGSIYLRWPEPVKLNLDRSFFEVVANLLLVAMERSLPHLAVAPTEATRREVSETGAPAERYPGFVGASKVLARTYEVIDQVAPTNACVLIRGESGTGKELVARIIHLHSPRHNDQFVALNCAAIPESLLESELFGIEKGTATGVTARQGKFELAHRGTLFLDEIGDMSLSLQAKLLRVLEDHRIEHVGGRKLIDVDTRIIAATHRNLDQAIREGQFRSDLYFRLNVVTINLPPLRKRPEDVPLLVQHFVRKYAEEFQRPVSGVAADVIAVFMAHDWPGNVRELKHAIERAVILSRSDLIEVSDLPPAFHPHGEEGEPIATAQDLRELRRKTQESAGAVAEKNLILTALKDNDWNVAEAARQVGLSRTQFYRLMRKYNLKRSGA
jgi:two-component system response regulator AtoC